MAIVCGLDLHRRQITFDTVEVESGEEWRGRIWQPDRARFRRWLREDVARRADGEVAVAVEGCTGWRYVVEEITAAGFEAHVAEPADTQAARGRKHRAKTDRTDARLLRDLLVAGELPESWIPPEAVLEWRERVRLYKSLVDQRTVWCQRIHAELYQHGVTVPEGAIRTERTRTMLADPHLQLSPAARQRIEVGYRMIDLTDTEAQPLKKALTRFGTRQPACRALVEAQYGIGGLLAVAVWSELGDCRRFCRSDQAVRHRPGRQRRRFGPASCRRLPVPAGTPDSAMGAVRGGQELVTSSQPRPRLLRPGQEPSRRQDRGHLGRSEADAPVLPHPARDRPRSGLRHPGLNRPRAGSDGWERPLQHHRRPRSAPETRMPTSPRAVRPQNTDATAPQLNGGHPITIVVADDISLVEHPGNAGRPHVADRPIPSLHRPSGWSRSYVLASLRALHLDQRLRPGAIRAQRAFTGRPSAHRGPSPADLTQVTRGATAGRKCPPTPGRGR
jgi:transposase